MGVALFTVRDRERLQKQLLTRAKADDAVVGAAFTGSQAAGASDRWSDTDLILAVRGKPSPVANQWTRWIYDELRAQHHWDLPAGHGIIRVFLLPGWLELDLTFAPEDQFGPRGPQWQTIFGQARSLENFPAPDRNTLAGMAWHHALHARICIERGRRWQAEHWISGLRDHVISLASVRLGYPAYYAKGAHLLPDGLMGALETALVRSLDEPELRRALAAAINIVTDELAISDPELATTLRPMFAELSAPDACL
jgi:hypothetical protein